MPMSNKDNVPTNDATEKYRGAVGKPVSSESKATFGAIGGTVPTSTSSTEVVNGGRGQPVNN